MFRSENKMNSKSNSKNAGSNQDDYQSEEDGLLENRKTFSGHSTFTDRFHENNMDSSLASVLGLEGSKREDDNVNVAIRVRPSAKDELIHDDAKYMNFPGQGQIQINAPNKLARADTGYLNKPKVFNFNVVFEPGTNQQDVFEHSGIKHLIDRALDGFACTILAYGQTGSGKTYTLSGPPMNHSVKDKTHRASNAHEGLMQRCFRSIFQQLRQRNLQNYVIKASYLEIYNEQIIDLLNPGQKKYLTVRWNKIQGFLVENLFLVECLEEDDIMAVLEEGLLNRQIAANNVNETSSRSHCILTVHIDHEVHVPEDNAYIEVHGKIMFVDLAGSEKVHAQNTRGSRNETNKINRSLLTLGKCISTLADDKKKLTHIPYRDSKLTKLLQEALEGKGFTLMIACISSDVANTWESLNTLHYAARMKLLENQPIVNMDPREELIRKLRKENRLLKAENIFLKEKLKIPIQSVRSSSAPQSTKNLRLLESLKNAIDNGQTSFPPQVSFKEIYNVVKDYKIENDSLRDENTDLLRTREFLIRDQELLSRENERLVKKLENTDRKNHSPSSLSSISDVENSSSSPQSASRTSVGRPPPFSTPTRPPHRLPGAISNGLKPRIPDVNGTANTNIKQKPFARRNSWDLSNREHRINQGTTSTNFNKSNLIETDGASTERVRRSKSDKNLAKRKALPTRNLGLLDHI